MRPNKRAVIAGVILFFVVIGGLISYLSFFYQPAPVVRDQTLNQQAAPQVLGNSAAYIDEKNVAVFSAGVNIFTETEAQAVNSAINQYTITTQGLILEMDAGSPMGNLGVGDIFFLDGGADTPLGETYIGRIVSESQTDGTATYVIEDPAIDEVFDVLNIDCEGQLTNDKIVQLQTLDGVTVTQGNGQISGLAGNESENTGYHVTPLSHIEPAPSASNLSSGLEEDLMFELVDVDLLKLFSQDKSANAKEEQEEYSAAEASAVTVYLSSTGICYHKEECNFLGKNKTKIPLRAAVLDNRKPCLHCSPPKVKSEDEDSTSPSGSVKLNGNVGLKDLLVDVIFDWDIFSGNGINDAAINISGAFSGEISVESNCKLSVGGSPTEIALPGDCVKLQGLSEKMIPIAFVGYNFATTVSAVTNDDIYLKTRTFPLTIGVIVYVDINGNLTFASNVSFSYNQPFHYSHTLIRAGELVDEKNHGIDMAEFKINLNSEISGDLDVHGGVSCVLYIFNLNLLEVALVKVGVETEGSIKIDLTFGKDPVSTVVSSSCYSRVYLKLLELNLKFKAKFKLGKWQMNLPGNLHWILLDYTIYEKGVKNQTRYKPSEMGYSPVTAYDAKHYYYKDSNGHLIQEVIKDGKKRTIYDEEFFVICGIDESYIYLLRNNPEVSNAHDIYRVSLENNTSKRIVEAVTNCLTMDEEYIYYISDFDPNTVLRMDRENLEESTFYAASGKVNFMAPQDGGFYLVQEDDNIFSWLFGSEPEYLLLKKEGGVTTEYGKTPSVPSMYLYQMPGYYVASKMVSSGYLRNQASEVYWLSNKRDSWEKAESISGWTYHDVGIFANVQDDSGENKIVLYRAEDGQRQDVTNVSSDQAFFTLCQSHTGSWFFFDQTEDSRILYSIDKDFHNKQIIKTVSLEELPCNLNSCGTTVLGNRIFFYTMPDNTTSQVLDRYDIA